MMARITFSSLLLQFIVLVFVLSPTANCLSLEDRFEQLTQEFVRKLSFILLMDPP